MRCPGLTTRQMNQKIGVWESGINSLKDSQVTPVCSKVQAPGGPGWMGGRMWTWPPGKQASVPAMLLLRAESLDTNVTYFLNH